VTKLTDPRSQFTTFAYSLNDLASVTDALNRTSVFFTDLLGRTTQSVVTLSRFHVHQNVVNFLMKGERDGQEGTDIESAVHR